MGALAVAVGVAGCGQRRVASGERKLRREIGQQKQSKQNHVNTTVNSMVGNKPARMIALLLLDTSNARSLSLPTRYLNPSHVLNDLAPRRRFLKLINIDPRNHARRRGTTEQPVQILTSGKQQMYMRCFAIVFTW